MWKLLKNSKSDTQLMIYYIDHGWPWSYHAHGQPSQGIAQILQSSPDPCHVLTSVRI